MSGKLEKLKIESYFNAFYIGPPIATYEAMFNPTSYKTDYKVDYFDSPTLQGEGSPQIFNKIKAQDFSIELLVDGTGTSGVETDVSKDIKHFMRVCGQIQGGNTRPSFLKIVWGSLVFKAVLKSASINYTLFKPDGKPLRAKINANFSKHSSSLVKALLKLGKSTPLGKTGVFKAADTLHGLSKKAYGDPNLYIELAKANNRKSLRNPTEGESINFPPSKI